MIKTALELCSGRTSDGAVPFLSKGIKWARGDWKWHAQRYRPVRKSEQVAYGQRGTEATSSGAAW